jgi:DNA polymerase III subunit epsilon
MGSWYEGPLTAFCAGATGPDAEADRILSAAVVVQDAPGTRPRVTRWLVNPGVAVPESAAAAHGLSLHRVEHEGRWPAPVVDEVARELAGHTAAGRPLVVADAPAGLTLLDRELRRHRATSLAGYLAGGRLSVLDPQVLDGHLDRGRTGRRTLADLCARYGVARAQPHDAGSGALAALEVVRAMGAHFAGRLEPLTPAELHALQTVWYAAQVRDCPGRFASGGGPADTAWPVRGALPSAA